MLKIKIYFIFIPTLLFLFLFPSISYAKNVSIKINSADVYKINLNYTNWTNSQEFIGEINIPFEQFKNTNTISLLNTKTYRTAIFNINYKFYYYQNFISEVKLM